MCEILLRLRFDLADDMLPGLAAGGTGISSCIDVTGLQQLGVSRNQLVKGALILLRILGQGLVHKAYYLVYAVVNCVEPGRISAKSTFFRL